MGTRRRRDGGPGEARAGGRELLSTALRKGWQRLTAERRALLQLLSRCAISEDQALRFYDSDRACRGRDRGGDRNYSPIHICFSRTTAAPPTRSPSARWTADSSRTRGCASSFPGPGRVGSTIRRTRARAGADGRSAGGGRDSGTHAVASKLGDPPRPGAGTAAAVPARRERA